MELLIESLDRHEDTRGWVSEVYSGEIGDRLQNIHLGSLTPGHVRGNHRHNRSREWIVFLQSPVRFRYQQHGRREERVLREPSRIQIPPGVAHGFRNEADRIIHFVAYRDVQYDPDNPDAEPVELFESRAP